MRRSQKAPDMEQFRVILKSKGFKATPQRLAVHEAMLAKGHASADQVCEWIKENGSTGITVATVYNILTQLAAAGVYKHLPSRDSKMYFDVNTFYHLHIYDRKNDEYKDVFDKDFTTLLNNYFKTRKYKGYRVEDIDIQLICHPSRTSKKNSI